MPLAAEGDEDQGVEVSSAVALRNRPSVDQGFLPLLLSDSSSDSLFSQSRSSQAKVEACGIA